MRTIWLFICILWVMFAAGLATWAGFGHYLHPPNLSPLGTTYLIGFGSAIFVMGALCPFRRGRLLICTVLLALAGLVGTGIVTSGEWPVFLTLGWLIVLAAMIGRHVLRLVLRLAGYHARSDAAPDSFAPGMLEKNIIQIGLGFAVLIALTAVAGYAHLLYQNYLLWGLAGLTVILIPGAIRPAREMTRGLMASFGEAWQGNLRLASFCLGAAALGFLCSLAFGLAPSMQYDAVNYHLGIPQLFLRYHGFVPVPEEYRVFWIYNGEILYTLALGLAGQPLPQLLHLAFAVMTAGLIFALAREVGGSRAAWLALLLFFTTPEVTVLSSWAFVEIFATFFTVAFLGAFIRWWRTEERVWLALAGIFCGLALSTKINTLFVMGPATLLAIAGIAQSPRLRPHFFKNLAWFAAPLALMGSPWMIRNWIQTGNPVFPFLDALFKSPLYDYWDHHQFYDNYGMARTLGWLRAFLRLPFDLVWRTGAFGEDTFDGAAGCIPLFAIPFAYPFFARERRPIVRLMLLFLIAYMICWSLMACHVRYLMPIFPIPIILGALTLDAIWMRLAKQLGPFSLFFILTAFMFFIAIPYLIAMRSADTETHWEDPQRYPLGLWTGSQTAEEYLDKHFFSTGAFKYIDSQAGGEHKVLAVGMPFRLYTTSRVYGSNRRYVSATINEALIKKLLDEKFDYLLLDKTRRETAKWDPVLVNDIVPMSYAENKYYVFDLKEYSRNLAVNPGFETLTTTSLPAKFSRFGAPVVDTSGKNAHIGRVAVRVDLDNGFFLPVAVAEGQPYRLGVWARAEKPGGKMRLQVNWHDGAGKYITTKIALARPTANWACYKTDVVPPPGARKAMIYITSHQKGFQVWMDDLTFTKR